MKFSLYVNFYLDVSFNAYFRTVKSVYRLLSLSTLFNLPALESANDILRHLEVSRTLVSMCIIKYVDSSEYTILVSGDSN